MSEGDLQRYTLDLAKTLQWRVARFPAANFVRTKGGREFVKPLERDTKGFPDALLVRDRLVAIEFKDAKGVISLEQRQWADALLSAGVNYYLFRPADWASGVIEAALT